MKYYLSLALWILLSILLLPLPLPSSLLVEDSGTILLIEVVVSTTTVVSVSVWHHSVVLLVVVVVVCSGHPRQPLQFYTYCSATVSGRVVLFSNRTQAPWAFCVPFHMLGWIRGRPIQVLWEQYPKGEKKVSPKGQVRVGGEGGMGPSTPPSPPVAVEAERNMENSLVWRHCWDTWFIGVGARRDSLGFVYYLPLLLLRLVLTLASTMTDLLF